MHELSVTESILEIALRHGQAAQARRITDLYLVIGQLTSLVDDSIQFYWDMIAQDTLAQGARLHFKRIQTELQCLDCHQRYTPGQEQMACTACEGVRVRVVARRRVLCRSHRDRNLMVILPEEIRGSRNS
jgi:hydrogenase nickel incorporation protein HypA/HybF